MMPIEFDGCFGWLHPASGGRGVVLCGPHATEELILHRAWRDFAETLAASGLPTLRFDYHGMGDSAGGDEDPGRVRAWIDSVRAAVKRLRAETGVAEVTLVGLRLGATLAASAAAEIGGVDRLVLMAPCVSGKAFARETRALARMIPLPEGARQPDPAKGIEAAGFLLTPETVEALNGLDLLALPHRPAPRVLLLNRPDAPAPAGLAQRLRDLGAEVEEDTLPDFAALMRATECGPASRSGFERVASWLAEAMPLAGSAPMVTAAEPVLELPGAVERPVLFGPDGGLFGVYCAPSGAATARPALLFVNSGATHHVGSGRAWVVIARRLAALGFSSLRIDVSGLGDSAGRTAGCDNLIYHRGSLGDVLAAVDWLESRGHSRCTVVGLCAGGALALNAALADPRVTGQVVINPGRFFLGAGITTEDIKKAALHKDAGGYLRQLTRPGAWKAVLRADRRAAGIARSLLIRAAWRTAGAVGDAAARLFGRETSGPGNVPQRFRRLAARGVDTLLVYSRGDVTLGERDLRLGPDAERVRDVPRLRLVMLDGADHSLTLRSARERFMDLLEEHLLQSQPAEERSRAADATWSGGGGCGILDRQSTLPSAPRPCASPPS
ncbi:alpha/beta hydrolase [Azospirillum sp. SYSU D00513]|uniref:serine aminopeptidase domain-containing protein n=1 Tax=Azospirillum sp. SYSU D00513 TaxID=2812561 RepID=UPI001A9617AC|nr:alpha/beta hydrolase [Azospirillum sp. SYSU D00513]